MEFQSLGRPYKEITRSLVKLWRNLSRWAAVCFQRKLSELPHYLRNGDSFYLKKVILVNTFHNQPEEYLNILETNLWYVLT